MILRRLYLYVVSAASLAIMATGLVLLGNTALLFTFNDAQAQYSRSTLATFAAMTLVALPVWSVHILFARRFAMLDLAERASAIRRLYVYLACLALSVGATIAIEVAVARAVSPFLDRANFDALGTSQAAWATAVLLALWALHFTMATSDRVAAGEQGASATLRRWYMYVALFFGLFTMLNGAAGLIQAVWLEAVGKLPGYWSVGTQVGQLVAGFLLWSFHGRVIATRYIDEDRKSTLRAFEGFFAVAVSIVVALVGASQILYYVLARSLGVTNPGGTGNDILFGLAAPVSQVVVYGVAWFLIRQRLARDAGAEEAERQAGIRRLYTNLVALVSLAALSVGAAGALAVLAQQVEAPLIGVKAPPWQDPLSLSVTLLVVGAGVWLANWRHAPWLAERQSLSRRLYIWAALLGSVLALLGSGIYLLYVVLQQLFSAQPRLDDLANLGFGQSLAVLLVAIVVGSYHWRVMRADARARPPKQEHEAIPAAAAVPVAAIAPQVPAPPVAGTVAHGMQFTLTVADATEDDVHQALSNLPPHASYKLTPAEPSS
jgi:hypothetical protein